MNRGILKGNYQGMKPGIQQGLCSGLSTGLDVNQHYMDKWINPQTMIGTYAPRIFSLMDFNTNNGNFLSLTNLMNNTYGWTMSNTPEYHAKNFYGIKDTCIYGSSDGMYADFDVVSTNDNELTVIMVFRPDAGRQLVYKTSSTISPTVGDMEITINAGGTTLRSKFVAGRDGGSYTQSNYDCPINPNDWNMITAKYRLSIPAGLGSEQEVFINGTKNMILFSNNTAISEDNTFTNTNFWIGNNASSTNAGNEIAACIIFNKWLDDPTRLKIENYLKWYYGFNF